MIRWLERTGIQPGGHQIGGHRPHGPRPGWRGSREDPCGDRRGPVAAVWSADSSEGVHDVGSSSAPARCGPISDAGSLRPVVRRGWIG
jgi:hypothetical protein